MPLIVVTPSQGRVENDYDEFGVVTGWRDPDLVLGTQTGRIISDIIERPLITREQAFARLRFNIENARVEDSVGNWVPQGVLRTGPGGTLISGFNHSSLYQTAQELGINVSRFKPAANQSVIEHIVIVDSDGNLRSINISARQGIGYKRADTASKWGAQVRDALGVKQGQRIDYRALNDAVVLREFLIVTHETF